MLHLRRITIYVDPFMRRYAFRKESRMRRSLSLRLLLAAALSFTLSAGALAAGGEGIPVEFDEEHWNFFSARKAQYLGRDCLMGYAVLKDVEFGDGVIEMDMALTGERTYAGFVFRIQGRGDYEHFYIRPHREGLYGDDLQYAPVTNGISSWQLYNGEGFSASWDAPNERWFHVRLEVSGSQARVFVDGAQVPALVIHRLRHGVSRGSIGVQGQADGTAYFSNFSYTPDEKLEFDPPPPIDREPGFITDWQVSQVFPISEIDIEDRFEGEFVEGITWKEIASDETGLVDIARTCGRTGREADAVFCRAEIDSESGSRRQFRFGYSDYIGVFLNGELLFTGNSAYRQRDPSFLGIVGLNDEIYLPLEKGTNELVLLVAESFGGWGFILQDAEAVDIGEGVSRKWETGTGLRTPESAVWDGKRKVIYVSNFDQFNFNNPSVKQFISRVGGDGKIIDLKWVGDLRNPTGMVISGDMLYVVERTGVAVIDIERGEIAERNPVPSPGFINDIAADGSGRIYVSDSRRSVIYRWDGKEWEEWLSDDKVSAPNAIMADGGRLLVGSNGDNLLKAFDLESGEGSIVADLGPGNIDGIKKDGKGNLIVSHWRGKLFRIDRSGRAEKILDSRALREYSADFDYVEEDGTVVIPSFYGNRVIAYEVDRGR